SWATRSLRKASLPSPPSADAVVWVVVLAVRAAAVVPSIMSCSSDPESFGTARADSQAAQGRMLGCLLCVRLAPPIVCHLEPVPGERFVELVDKPGRWVSAGTDNVEFEAAVTESDPHEEVAVEVGQFDRGGGGFGAAGPLEPFLDPDDHRLEVRTRDVRSVAGFRSRRRARSDRGCVPGVGGTMLHGSARRPDLVVGTRLTRLSDGGRLRHLDLSGFDRRVRGCRRNADL